MVGYRSLPKFGLVLIADIDNARLIRLALAGFLRCLLKVRQLAMSDLDAC